MTITSTATSSCGVTPRDCDILCGKGKVCVTHPGSRRFRRVIDEYSPRYGLAVTKQAKMAITKEIYDMLGAQGVRFLKECTCGDNEVTWEELTSLAARDKVSHALRFANRGQGKSGGVPSNITTTSARSVASSTSSSRRRSRVSHHRRTGSDSSNDTISTAASDLPPPLTVPSMNLPMPSLGGEELTGNFLPLVTFAEEEDDVVTQVSANDEPLDINVHRRGKAPYYDMSTHSWFYPPATYHEPQQQSSSQKPVAVVKSSPPPPPMPEYASPTKTSSDMHYEPYHYSSHTLPPAPTSPAATTAAHQRHDTSDELLNFIMQEPLMEWDLETDHVFFAGANAA